MAVLKAKIAGVWTDVAGASPEEIFIGPNDPGLAYDLWYDTDDPGLSDTTVGRVESGTYTPTLGGMNVGTGGSASNTARYTFVGAPGVGGEGILSVHGVLAFGTTGVTFPSDPTFALPPGFNINYVAANAFIVGFAYQPQGGALMHLFGLSAAAVALRAAATSGAYAVVASITPTVPYAWVAGYAISYQYTVRAVRV